jgi:Virulence factor BrkB
LSPSATVDGSAPSRCDGRHRRDVVHDLPGQLRLVQQDLGTIAGVIILLVWLWITNLAVLLGAQLNAELERGRQIEGGLPADEEPFLEHRDTKKLGRGP